MEYQTLGSVEGVGSGGNPALAQLIKNLSPAGRPILRVGGDSTDWSWWPVAGLARPHGITIGLGPDWVRQARTLIGATRARVILGINLEADRTRIAATEARALVSGLGRRNVAALEVGNEPELYSGLPWYETRTGKKEFGRPRTYNLSDYTGEFNRMAGVLPRLPLAGPSMFSRSWDTGLGRFFLDARGLGLVTFHAYAVDRYGYPFLGRGCAVRPGNPAYPTISKLLAPSSSAIAATALAPYIARAHADHLRARVDEMNAITCDGVPGISNTFASALWSLGALFDLDRAGADGVNVHTWGGSAGQLFGFTKIGGDWAAAVRPEYYGLLMFAQAAPTGSELLDTTERDAGPVQSWATLARDGTVRVVLINRSLRRTQEVKVATPRGAGSAQLEWLTAPRASSTTGVVLNGQSFGNLTTTGILPPATTVPAVSRRSGGYAISVPAASAVLLTIP